MPLLVMRWYAFVPSFDLIIARSVDVVCLIVSILIISTTEQGARSAECTFFVM